MNYKSFDLSLLEFRGELGLKKSNKETLAAIRELDEGRGTQCSSIDDFWDQMGMSPDA